VGWAGPDKYVKLSPRKSGSISTQNGWADLDPIFFFFSFWGGSNPAHPYGLGQIRSGPYSKLIILQNVNNYCSRSARNQMVAEVGDGRRRRLPGAAVTTVIKRLRR